MDSESKEKKSIPKFASFRPKPTTEPETAASKAKGGLLDDKSERSRHISRHSKQPHESRSRRRRRRRSRDEHRSRRPDHQDGLKKSFVETPTHSTRNETNEPAGSKLFIEDRKGDKYNVTYGSLDRYSIPQYNRGGRGSVLGLPTSYKIDRDLSDEKTLVITQNLRSGDNGRKKNRNKNLLPKLSARGTKLVRIRPDSENDGSFDAQRNFLSLDSGRGRKRRRIQETGDFRSIDPTIELDPELSSDLEEVSDSDLRHGDEVDLDDNEEAKSQQIELSKRVQERPDDIDAWLKLIDHQDALIATVGGDRTRKFTTAEMQSVADIKVSMYEKALTKASPGSSRDRLLLGMLDEGSKIWLTTKLSGKWRDILKEYPHYISLWTKYLDFQQTQFMGFTYDQCRSVFSNCLEINDNSNLDRLANVNIKLYLFLRMTLFMREAGFTEHAVGLWQAVLEFNFFSPQEFVNSRDSAAATSSFADFWESEVARIGEVGAKGWKGGNGITMEPRPDVSKARVDTESIFGSWVICERERELNSRLPARTLDDVEEDDPYRVILFSDIEEFLIPFSSPVASDMLINSFLTFCHLPPLLSYKNIQFVEQWRGDPFLRNDLLDRHDGQEWLPDLRGGSEASTLTSSKVFPQQSFIATPDTLFEDGTGWYSSLEVWKRSYVHNEGPVDPNWVRRTLRNLVDENANDDSLAEYALAVEFVCSPKEARKYAKSLLKKRSSSLRLYNAYSLIECRNGNLDTAEHVWTTTLSMSKRFSVEDRMDRIILWRTWLWEIIEKRDYSKAIRLLLAMPDYETDPAILMEANSDTEISVSPAEFLKTQRFLSENQEHALSLRKAAVYSNFTECLALLFYTSRSSDINSGTEIYQKADQRLMTAFQGSSQPLAFFRELLHQAKAKLLHHHINTTKKYKPATIRDDLEGSVHLFPHNTIFLSLFAQNEAARFLRIDDRVRALTREMLSSSRDGTTASDSIIPHFFSVYSELQRGAAASGADPSTTTTAATTTAVAHSVRAAFEHAFDTRAGRSSAALWKLYVLFEISQGRADLSRRVFYRGVRACPWAKALVMVAFTHLREAGAMDFEELRKVYNIFVEKELRLHVDLEEVFEEYDEEAEKSVSGGRNSGDDLPITTPLDASDNDSR